MEETQQQARITRGLLHVPDDLPAPLEESRSSVIGIVAALQLPADLDIIVGASVPGLFANHVLGCFWIVSRSMWGLCKSTQQTCKTGCQDCSWHAMMPQVVAELQADQMRC